MVACPTCGKELTFIPQYDRWYCYAEGAYAPKGFAEGTTPPIQLGGPATESHEGHHHCPDCGKELAFIQQYDRWYCFAEGKYAPKDVQPVGVASAQPIASETASPIPVEYPAAAPVTEPAPVEPVPTETVKTEESRPSEVAPADMPVDQPRPAVAAEEPRGEAPMEPPPSEVPRERGEEPVVAPGITVREAEIPAVAVRGSRSSKRDLPKLSVFQIQKAKKAKLAQWCEAYELESSGTRIELRDRLLQFLDEQDREDEEEVEVPESATPIETPPPEPATEREPMVEPPTEPSPWAEPVVETPPAFVEPAPTPEPEPAPQPEPEPEPPAIPETAPEPEPAPVSELPAAESIETPFMEPARAAEPTKVEPTSAALPPPPVVVEVAKALPCPNCGKDLAYIAQYDRLYCFSCGRYAPKTYGKEGAVPVALRPFEVPGPEPPVEPVVIAPPRIEPPKVEARPAHPCPTCGRELRFVRDYDRWWCEAERKYAPKEYGRKPRYACPSCGADLTWIKEYQRWYCYAEGKYGPKTIPAPGAATVMVARPAVAAAAVAPPAVRVDAASFAAMEQRMAALESAEHAHGRPSAGIGLAAVGFSLVIVWFLLLPDIGPLDFLGAFDPVTLGLQTRQILSVLAFIGLVLAMSGVALGLSGVRRR